MAMGAGSMDVGVRGLEALRISENWNLMLEVMGHG